MGILQILSRLFINNTPSLESEFTDENKYLIRQFVEEVLNQRNQETIDLLIDENFVDHDLLAESSSGLQNFKQGFAEFCAAYPDSNFRIEKLTAEGSNKVVARIRVKGTRLGWLHGQAPTEKIEEWVEFHIIRIVSNKIVENHSLAIRALGVITWHKTRPMDSIITRLFRSWRNFFGSFLSVLVLLVIIALIFIITLMIFKPTKIDQQATLSLFIVSAQILAALLGLAVAFLTLAWQGIAQELTQNSNLLKSNMKQLLRRMQTRPSDLRIVDDSLIILTRSFEYLREENIPILSREYDALSRKEAVLNLQRKWEQLYGHLPWSARRYFEEIISLLVNIDNSFRRLGELYVYRKAYKRDTLPSLIRISLLLFMALMLLVALGTNFFQTHALVIDIPIISSFMAGFLFILIDLLLRAWSTFSG